MKTPIGLAALLCLSAGSAGAADAVTTIGRGSDFGTLSLALGHLSGQALERVYDEDGSKVSELVWDMNHALALNAGAAVQLASRLSLYGHLAVGLAADNHMDDYDWLEEPPPADPSDHSWHGDTRLDHYYTLVAGAAFALFEAGDNRVSLLGGLKYTDVKWTAYGGCFDYGGITGCFEDGEKGISYQLRLPAAYLGLGYIGSFDRWSLSLEGRAGMTVFGPEAEDDHWLTGVNYLDHLGSEPYLAVSGKASYAISDTAAIFASAAYDAFFEMRGKTTYTDMSTGESLRSDYDVDGAALRTLNLAVGVDVRF